MMELFAAHSVWPVDNIDLAIKCAALHDTQEDQGVSYDTLCARFGEAVARGVGALSKDPALPKAEAMADSLARIRQQPTAIWCVKMADRIVNLAAPPAHWSQDKVSGYRREAALILAELGEAHGVLAERLAEKIKLYPPAA
ncbi:bifunctional (p)ppGpp synthetase/guanosine-3',5'-bis(diphosphate) 3'-pyrophosphohydrolase [Paraburkholderia jirisanensis]